MFVAVHDEELVGVVGQFVEAAQVAQHDFQGHVLAHGDHVEVHDGAHRIVRVGHRRPQFFALLHRQGLENVGDDPCGRSGARSAQFVGIEGFGGGHHLFGRPIDSMRLPNGVRDLEQDFAFALGLDQIPGDQSFIGGRASRMKATSAGCIGSSFSGVRQMLLMHQTLDQVVARPRFLAMNQVLNQFVPGEQGLHLGEALLQVFGIGEGGPSLMVRRRKGARIPALAALPPGRKLREFTAFRRTPCGPG